MKIVSSAIYKSKALRFRSLGQRFAGTALLFSGFVSIGTALVLLFSSCLGYLPYSDRPGPGWWGRIHWPSLAESAHYIEFVPWFAYFCLYFGLGLFGLSLVLGIASTPRWLNRLIGGLVSAVAAGLAVMGAGWYFALAEIGPDGATILGLIYGIFLFPCFVESRSKPLPIWTRISAVAVASTLFLYWMVSPLLPKKTAPELSYDLIRVTAGDKSVTAAPGEGSDVSRELAALNLHGETHGGIGGIGGMSSGQDTTRIYVELVALELIMKEANLTIPRGGYVVYVLKNGSWTAHPAVSKKDKRTLIVEPGSDARYEGGRLKLGSEKGFDTFTWYPVIPRKH